MRNILGILTLMISFVACKDSTNTSLPASPVALTVNQVDTTPPARPRVAVSTARPVSKMETTFPYDIDLKTADGKLVKSSEVIQAGKPTVLLFWLTTCYPCRVEMKAIQKEIAKWHQEVDFQLLAISTDFSKNYNSFVKLVEKSNWPFPAYNDVNREFRQVMPGALNGLPQTFIFDAKGEIIYHKRKYNTGDEQKIFEILKSTK